MQKNKLPNLSFSKDIFVKTRYYENCFSINQTTKKRFLTTLYAEIFASMTSCSFPNIFAENAVYKCIVEENPFIRISILQNSFIDRIVCTNYFQTLFSKKAFCVDFLAEEAFFVSKSKRRVYCQTWILRRGQFFNRIVEKIDFWFDVVL